jgi:adenosylcobyric acid synthase
MLQGTGSDVGKSLLVAGVARALTRRGLRVRPFKPQNMSNNAAVTLPQAATANHPAVPGGEIGRAQALQARACGVAPSVLMNPVLLKPQSDVGSQVVLCGKVLTTAKAADYHALKPSLLPRVLESFHQLAAEADLVIIEGAGSAAEVNLRAADIANMGFAEAADVPVVLIGDIDRGGVLAQIVGTHALISAAEQARIKGFLINKFRGDPALFADGVTLMEQRTGWPSCGVIPWFPQAAHLPAEDGMALDQRRTSKNSAGKNSPGKKRTEKNRLGADRLLIAVPRLSRIANFDDFDPLAAEPNVDLVFVAAGTPIPAEAGLVILPGSKSTRDDLAFLRAQGWDIDLQSHLRRGGAVLGICAGFQMLGQTIADPQGIEGSAGETVGLGFLDLQTTMGNDKTLSETHATDHLSGCAISGYEMHMGQTQGDALARPLLSLDGRPEGAVSADGRVMGCYLHGLFASDRYRAHLLQRFGQRATVSYDQQVERALDALADHLERHGVVERLLALAAPLTMP